MLKYLPASVTSTSLLRGLELPALGLPGPPVVVADDFPVYLRPVDAVDFASAVEVPAVLPEGGSIEVSWWKLL